MGFDIVVAVVVAGKGRMGNELSLEDRYGQMANMVSCSEVDAGREGRRDQERDRQALGEGNQGWKLVGVLLDARVVVAVVLETVLVQGEMLELPMVQDQGLAAGLEEHELVRDLGVGLGVARVPVREQYPGWPLEG